MKPRALILLLLGSAFTLPACMGFGDQDAAVLDSVPENPQYSEVAQIMATYCLRCHNTTNPQGDFRADTYEELFKMREDAQGEVDQGLMPPLSEPPMALVDRETFVKWVSQGAPEVVEPPAEEPVE